MRGCEAGHYNTLTHAHTHQYVWVLPVPVSKPMKAGFYPTRCGCFLWVPKEDS